MGAAEQSSSAGLLMGDQLQLRDGGVDVVFGCETKETGEIYNQEADGILGLGNSEVSMVNQVPYAPAAILVKRLLWDSLRCAFEALGAKPGIDTLLKLRFPPCASICRICGREGM